MHFLRLVAALFFAVLAAGAVWWFADRPVPVAVDYALPFSNVSFAAYRRGESPLTRHYPTPAEVEQDMAILVGKTRGIRTYTTHEGLEGVPALAEKYGIKVTLGCWLGRDPAINEKEVSALIEQANAHPDSVQRVIVGNEVLLRGDLTPDQLIGYIQQVKAAIKQPVSTADVVSFVLKYPQVGRELDYITTHILPFWDDYPLGLDEVEQDTVSIVDHMRATFPGKPILIGEIGWPSIGRDRGPAVVNEVNQADFVRRIARLAAEHDFDYNIVEAFDQPWKSQLEGTVGGAWGMMEADRTHGGTLKFPMAGPVRQVPDWQIRAGWAIGLGAVAALLFARTLPGFGAMLIFALAAQILSWLAVTSIFHAQAVTFRSWQYWWLIVRVAVPALLFGAIAARLRDWLASEEDGDGARLWLGSLVMPAAAAYALVWSILLFLDGYYRDSPEFDFALPVGGVLVMAVVRLTAARQPGETFRDALSIEEFFPGRHSRAVSLSLGWLLLIMAPLTLVGESWALAVGRDFITAHPTFAQQLPYLLNALVWNREMDLWSAMQLLWAVPFLLARKPASRIGLA